MNKIKLKKYFHYFFLYCTVSYGGMALPSYIGGNERFSIMMFLISIIIIIIIKSKLYIKIRIQYFIFIILLLLLLSVFTTSTLSIGSIYTIISTLIVVYSSYIYNPFKYLQRILLISFILAIISIILFSMQSFIGAYTLGNIMPFSHPIIINNKLEGFHSLYYNVSILHMGRNCGPFGEPGQYQIMLCTALYFTLFKEQLYEKKMKIWYIIFFFIALITTMSTSGYLALFILIFCYYLYTITNTKRIDKKTITVFKYIVLLSTIFFFLTKTGQDFFQTAIIQKIDMKKTGLAIFSNSSGSARTISIENYINAIYSDPTILWGIGFDEMQKKGIVIDGAVGFINLLGAIGLIPFIFLFYFCCNRNIKYSNSKWESCCCILLFINASLGQPHIINPLLFSMFLFTYFYKNTPIHKKIKINDERFS